MRVTRETLLKIVRETVAQRTRADRGIQAVYLHGSILEDDFFSLGSVDVDLFFVHASAIPLQREIVSLTEEVHLDIAHHLQRDYRNTRSLRIDSWLGPTIKDSRAQFDPHHFLDFTQASVRGQFDRADYVLERSHKLFDRARQAWMKLHGLRRTAGVEEFLLYLHGLEDAANSIALLSGAALTERRFLLRLPERCVAARRAGLSAGFLGLIGAQSVTVDRLAGWMPFWQAAYQALEPEAAPARLHPDRLGYYQRAFETLVSSGQPQAATWPLLCTWTRAVAANPNPGVYEANWRASLEEIDLLGKNFPERVAGLDALLDMVEETLDQWAADNGANLA